LGWPLRDPVYTPVVARLYGKNLLDHKSDIKLWFFENCGVMIIAGAFQNAAFGCELFENSERQYPSEKQRFLGVNSIAKW